MKLQIDTHELLMIRRDAFAAAERYCPGSIKEMFDMAGRIEEWMIRDYVDKKAEEKK